MLVLRTDCVPTHPPAELATVKGSDLVGLKYVPMFGYFADRDDSFKVCEDNYVTNESGTGIVHQVGGFGRVGLRASRVQPDGGRQQ